MNATSVEKKPLRVLLVDDDEAIRFVFRKKLEQVGFVVDEAKSVPELRAAVKAEHYNAILLDNYLENQLGIDCIPEILQTSPTSHIVMLTAFGSIDSAVNALNCGASGFLVKTDSPDANVAKFCSLLDYHADHQNGKNSTFNRSNIISKSPILEDIFAKLGKVSPTDATVLIGGESGTGKELIARAIHNSSTRAGLGPFIAINCGAITESLLEAELFGSVKGSYTGSTRDRKGYFETCTNGTLFLDEIGEMSPNLQIKLLRVLQEREITPVGSCQAIPIDTRIVAATNCNLLRDMKSGQFREDLYYRLSIIKVDLPPLRDRHEDIPLLVNYFLDRLNERLGKTVRPPNLTVLARLKAYSWPGNVRELQNAVERAVLLAESNELQIGDLIPIGSYSREESETRSSDFQYPLEFSDAKQIFEKSYVDQLLTATGGNISEAANVSGQYRPAIYRLIKKYDMDVSEYK